MLLVSLKTLPQPTYTLYPCVVLDTLSIRHIVRTHHFFAALFFLQTL